MRWFFALAVALLTAFVSVAGWWWFNRPVPVALSFNEPFPSVSFAPFRRGQSPLTHDYPPPAQVEADLKSLVGVAKGVRTYTSREGLEVVPGFARDLGLEVTHSAWLGKKLDVNDKEVAGLIDAANRYPDVVKRVIVGNEVLLRQDLPVDKLIEYIRKVKAQVKQPVSYADVWAFYLRYPQVADEVDYITIHILPYWEDEPIGVEDAAEHIVKIYRLIQERFPGKPILIGEAGWPTRGRDRGPAEVGMADAATFVRTLAKVSKENGFDYNVVEAFDQPWKAKMEGTVGAFWGVVDSDRRVKYTMSGPVQANPFWMWHAALSAVSGLAAALWFLWGRGRSYSVPATVLVAALAQGLAAAVVWQGLAAWWIAYDWIRDGWAVARIALQAVFAVLILKVAALSLVRDGHPVSSRWGERLLLIYGICAWAATMLIFFNGRYRDIPNLEFLVPCLGVTVWGAIRMAVFRLDWAEAFAVGRLFGGRIPGRFGPAKEMTWGLVVAAIMAPLSESLALWLGEDFSAMHPGLAEQLPLMARIAWANPEMLGWAAMLLVMAVPYLAEWRSADRP